MERETAKSILSKAISFLGTLVLSLTIVNSLPRYREKRQRSFARAVMAGNFYRLQMLSLSGVNVNQFSDGKPPLSIAAAQGRIDIVSHLLNHGAEINARDQLGHTALSEATFNGRAAVVEVLLMNGAEVNTLANDGTPLDIASRGNNTAMISLLKHYGAKGASELH